MQLPYLELAYTLGDGEAPGFENLVAPGDGEVAPDGWTQENSIDTIYSERRK